MKKKNIILLSIISLFALVSFLCLFDNKKVMASENNEAIASVSDDEILKSTLNIKDGKDYIIKDNNLIWNNKGIKNNIPVDVSVKYYLNNIEMNPKDMVSKSGKVKIVYNFKNNDSHYVSLNKENSKLYTPFVATLGMILDNNNSNITINNGKIISSESRNIVLGLATPGMYDNFKIDEFKNSDTISISFDTKNFELGNAYIIMMPKLADKSDFKVFDKITDTTKSIYLLEDSVKSLEEGVKKLENGSLLLTQGTSSLVSNYSSIIDGVNNILKGSNNVSAGLNKVVELLEDSLKDKDKDKSLMELSYLIQKNTYAKDNLVKMTSMDYATLMNYYQNNLVNYTGSDSNILALKQNCELIILLDGNVKALNASVQSLNSLNTLYESLVQLRDGSNTITSGLNDLSNGINKVYDGLNTLNSGANDLYNGIKQVSTGINRVNNEGIKTLGDYSRIIDNYSNKVEALINLSNRYENNTVFVYKMSSVR